MKNITLIAMLFVGLGCGLNKAVEGHEIYQDVMKERYILKSFSCKSCHPDSGDRKIRTPFAELIYQEMKDKKWSEKWAAVEKQGEDAIKAFEKEISKDFIKAMDVVGKKQMTFDQMLRGGLFNGARLDTKKIEEMEAAKKAAEAKK